MKQEQSQQLSIEDRRKKTVRIKITLIRKKIKSRENKNFTNFKIVKLIKMLINNERKLLLFLYI